MKTKLQKAKEVSESCVIDLSQYFDLPASGKKPNLMRNLERIRQIVNNLVNESNIHKSKKKPPVVISTKFDNETSHINQIS